MTEKDDVVMSEKPMVKELFDEFTQAGGMDSGSVQRERNRRLRFCQWPGRSSDYKKHRKALNAAPEPWEGAWDSRPFLVDDVMTEVGDAVLNGLKRAELSVRPTGAEDIAKAGTVSVVLQKYKERMPEFATEAEFMWSFAAQEGKAVWQVGWEKEVAMKRTAISMAAIAAAAASAARALAKIPAARRGQLDAGAMARLEELAQLPQMIMDRTREGEAVEVVQTFARQLAGELFGAEREAYGDDFLTNYEVNKARARVVVRELRKKGKSELAAPYLTRNGPCVTARRVGYDIFISAGCPNDIQRARCVQVREWLGEADLREMAAVYGWNKKWVELVLTDAKGKTSIWGDVARGSELDVEDDEDGGIAEQGVLNTKRNEVEVVHAYVKRVGPEGIPQVWCTVYCPHVLTAPTGEEVFAKHYEQEYLPNQYCFVPYRLEDFSRNFHESRGIPELAGCDQGVVKKMTDMLVDRADVEVNPPWQVHNRLAMRYKGGPGGQVPFQRKGDIEPMPPPTGNPELAFNLMEWSWKRVSNRWGLINEHVLPAKWQMKLARQLDRFLGSTQEVLKMVLKLIQQNATPEELERITAGGQRLVTSSPTSPTDGHQGGITPEEIAGEYDVSLYFDVKDLDMEFVFKKLDAISKMAVPLDRAGMIDMAQLVRLIMLAIDPTYARALITDQKSASQKMFQEVKGEIALMYLGNEPEYTEMDPAAEMKLQFGNQIIFGEAGGTGANLEYLEALGRLPGGDQGKVKPRFVELLQKWEQNLAQSIKQEKNKQVGRLGVDPES